MKGPTKWSRAQHSRRPAEHDVTATMDRTLLYCTVTVPTMPGWIVQRYGNDPAEENVIVNFAPGEIEPEFQAPLLAVDVCAVLSLLVHVTLPPTATVMGFGANAVVVIVDAPLTIDTGVPDWFVDGVGEGADDDEYDDPHANDAPRTAAANTTRKFMSAS